MIIKENIKDSILSTKKMCLTLRSIICWREKTVYVCIQDHTLTEDRKRGKRCHKNSFC